MPFGKLEKISNFVNENEIFDCINTATTAGSFQMGAVLTSTFPPCSKRRCMYYPLTYESSAKLQTVKPTELESVNLFGLPILAMPIEMEAVGMLVAIRLSAALVFLLTLKRRDVMAAFLFVSSSFFAQVSCTKGQMRALRRYLIPWLLLAGVAPCTPFIQSIVVIPRTVHFDLSLEEMKRQSFTFYVSSHDFRQIWRDSPQVELLETANINLHVRGWNRFEYFEKRKKTC